MGQACGKASPRRCEFFSNRTSFQVNNGESVKFWWDVWCSPIPLARIHPILFNLSSNKEALVEKIKWLELDVSVIGIFISSVTSMTGRWMMSLSFF